MATKIFVNLPVKDLAKSKEFFAQLGYRFNLQFTDEKAACMVISEDIYTMLLVEDFFKSFYNKEICDTKKYTETMICLSADSKDAVNELVAKAVRAGGTTPNKPNDQGFIYGWGFVDLDGHIWEVMWMDPAVIK